MLDLTTKKDQFLKGLHLAQSIADRKSTMPVLGHTLIRSVGKDAICCAATDLQVSVTAEARADVLSDGSVAVPADLLYSVVRSLPGCDVTLTEAPAGRVTVASDGASVELACLPGADFPALPEHRETEFREVDGNAISDMIAKTIFSVSTDETRRHLSGILMEWEGTTARMVSTDGHRLSKAEMELEGGLDLPKGVIIPRKGALETRQLLDGQDWTCGLAVKEENLVVWAGDVILTVKLVEAKFPPYRQVVPPAAAEQAAVDRAAVMSAVKRAAILAEAVTLAAAPGRLVVSGENLDTGAARAEIEADYSGPAAQAQVAARYLLDALGACEGDVVRLDITGQLSPVVVRDASGYVGVIMPMKV